MKRLIAQADWYVDVSVIPYKIESDFENEDFTKYNDVKPWVEKHAQELAKIYNKSVDEIVSNDFIDKLIKGYLVEGIYSNLEELSEQVYHTDSLIYSLDDTTFETFKQDYYSELKKIDSYCDFDLDAQEENL
jgi:hypothetical protein